MTDPIKQPLLKDILKDGAWRQNTGLVVLLGLCPLLAVTNTVINGLALGLATMLTLMASNLSVSVMRGLLRPEIRIPAFVLIIASVVTVIELLMHAFFYDLYRLLGIFIPLIVTNCAIIGRAEAFASRNKPLASLVDGFATGLIYGFLDGRSLNETVRLGWAHGALLTTFPGDTTMATLHEVEAFAKGGSARVQR